MWRHFHTRVRAPLEAAGIPVLMTPGNHDASVYPGFEGEREAYAAYHQRHPAAFSLLQGGAFPYHYAAAYKGLLLLSLDATATGALPHSQHQWLEKTLNTTGDYRAKLAFGHLPLQGVAVGREREVIDDPLLESLLVRSRVSIYLSGHHHAYYPGYRLGLDMLSVGNLGGNARRIIGSGVTPGFSFALLEFDVAGNLRIEAFRGPDFTALFDITTLPPNIGAGEKSLLRRDLASDGGNE